MAFGIGRPDTNFSIRVPGGVVIKPTVNNSQPTKFELAMSLMNQVNSVFAPLKPVLSLIRFAAAVVKFVEALPDVIAVPPDLAKLQEVSEELIESGSDLLAINPTTAYVPFVLDLINAARKLLDGMDEQLAAIDQVLGQAAAVRAASEQEFVTDAARLVMEETADCLDEVADTVASSVSDVLEPIDLLFGSINTIGKALGTQLLPLIGAAEGVDALRDVIEAFRSALALLP